MWDFLLSGDNVPFMAALVLMLLIGVVEATGLGGGLAGADAPEGPDGEVGAPSLLSWLNTGRLPLLMLLVVFLFVFGIGGLGGQEAAAAIFGRPAPWWLAAPMAMLAALPVTRAAGLWVARILPQDETTAVSRDSLVGRTAVVTTGEARAGHPAQARVRDRHGLSHYVMVEPDNAAAVLPQGAAVILVRNAGARYLAILDTGALLIDAVH